MQKNLTCLRLLPVQLQVLRYAADQIVVCYVGTGKSLTRLCGSNSASITAARKLVTCDHCRLLLTLADANGISFNETSPRHELERWTTFVRKIRAIVAATP